MKTRIYPPMPWGALYWAALFWATACEPGTVPKEVAGQGNEYIPSKEIGLYLSRTEEIVTVGGAEEITLMVRNLVDSLGYQGCDILDLDASMLFKEARKGGWATTTGGIEDPWGRNDQIVVSIDFQLEGEQPELQYTMNTDEGTRYRYRANLTVHIVVLIIERGPLDYLFHHSVEATRRIILRSEFSSLGDPGYFAEEQVRVEKLNSSTYGNVQER
jgi:hypothetical protein